MKKQYQLVIGILVTSVFFCTNKDNNLKACGSSTTACATMLKKGIPKKDIPTEYNEETDTGIYRFMNPFLQ